MSELHPLQSHHQPSKQSKITSLVTLRAYEVYCHLYGPQEALVSGWCRGGFSKGELIAFLYARSFPINEWNKRAEEAFNGMENI